MPELLELLRHRLDMKRKETTMNILKKIFLTLLFPVLMFLVMLLITNSSPVCHVNGVNIFLGADLVRFIILNTCMMVCIALAIWLQMKNGRFDFSTGSIMVITSIIAGNVGYANRSVLVALVLSVVCAVGFSVIGALLYVYGRLPIIISSIAITLVYESLTYLVFGGQGIASFYPEPQLNIFGRVPLILIPTVVAVLVFAVYDKFSVAGKKGKVLSNNQAAGVNIGLDEKKNTIICYVFSGIIIGMGSLIYVSQNSVGAQSGLTTTGVMFSYIAPVFMGMFVGLASNDVIGIIVSSIAISIMSYGLNCLNLGAGGWQNIIFGAFVMCFYSLSSQLDKIQRLLEKVKGNDKVHTA